MRQWFALDRARWGRYYAATAALLVGCVSRPARIGPATLPPLAPSVASQWAALPRPTRPVRYRLRWTYENQKGRTRGRAAVVLVPPDSVRFDYRAPFGRSGAAVVVGDSLVWGRPEDDVERMIHAEPLFWAAFGVPRDPPPGAAVTGREEDGRYVWRYAAARDTITYVLRAGSDGRLEADYRSANELVGVTRVDYTGPGWTPTLAVMQFPGSASRVEFSVEAIDSLNSVDPELWKVP